MTMFAMIPWNGSPTELSSVRAQTVQWNQTYGTIGREEAGYMIEVSTGGYLMAGGTDPGIGTGRDAWLVRIDANGNHLWNHSYGQSGAEWERLNDVTECNDGGFAATGFLVPDTVGINENVFVLKVDANGIQEWNSTFGGLSPEQGREIIEVSGGGFAVIGHTDQYGAGLDDVWLIRLDMNGNHLWNHTYGGSAVDAGWSLTETSGGFALFGRTESFGAGGSDMWLIHVDGSGNHLWNRTYGGSQPEWGIRIRELTNGDFGLCGDTLSYGPNTPTSENAFFLRVDSSGNHLWNQTYGGSDIEVAIDFKEDSAGGFVLAGPSRSYSAGAYDYYVMRTDAIGNLLWNHSYGGVQYERVFAVLIPSTGGIMVYGDSVSYGAGLEDFWILQLSDDPIIIPPPPLPIPLEWILIIAVVIIVIVILAIICIMRRR